MVNVLKEKSPPEGDHPQPARRRLSGRDRWFRSDDSELSSPREDSPLIYSDQEFSHEEKKAIDQWEPALLSENERAERSCCSEVRNKPATLSTVPTIMSAADEALLRTFMEVLSEGDITNAILERAQYLFGSETFFYNSVGSFSIHV